MVGIVLDPTTSQRVVERVIFLLNAFYEAEKSKKGGSESTSWRGQLGGFRCALEIIVGSKATNEILELVREETRKNLGESLGDGLMAHGFPQAERTHANLGYMYQVLGNHDKALVVNRRALEQNPTSAAHYVFLIGSYILLNRFKEAQGLIEEAESKNLDSPGLHFSSYLLAFLNRDAAGMEKQVCWGTCKPGTKHAMLFLEACTNAFYGRLKAARDCSRSAVSSAERAEEKELAASYQADEALREALFGNADEGRQRAQSALGLSKDRDVKYEAALALALIGDTANAQSLNDDFVASFPEETVVQFNYVPTLNAQLALSRNDACTAIQALQAAAPYELGEVGNTAVYPVFVRGEAFLSAHQGKDAAIEFQKIIDHRGIVINEPIGVLAHLGLARGYALQGDTAKARAAYQDFLSLWKDADPDIPVLIAARAEYAKLQ
jgi:tetratricopeptide (TPR) repeat protein